MQMGWRVGVWLLCSVLAAADTLPAPQFEKVVDQLLASPHFGERFGRYWLDLASYVDTVGRDVQANAEVARKLLV